MKLNRKLKFFWLVTALLSVGSLAGQDLKMNGFAGEDMSVLFLPNPENPYKEITLGSTDPGMTDGYCSFSWKVVKDPCTPCCELLYRQSKRPTLKVWNTGEYVLEATRVSKYGYQTETVCVTVVSEIRLVKATSNKDCWENGDPVNASDFDFVTDPPGLESYVQVHEDDRIIGRFWNWYGEEEVRFKIMNPVDETYQDCDVTAVIYVSRGTFVDFSTTIIGTGTNLPKNLATMKKFATTIKQAKKLTDKFKGAVNLAKSFLHPDFPITPDNKAEFNMDVAVYESCCESDGVTQKNAYCKLGGNLDFFGGVKVRAPLFPSHPKFGLFITGGFGVGFAVNGEFQLSTICFDPSLSFQPYFRVNVGAQISVMDPDIFSVNANLFVDGVGRGLFIVHPNVGVRMDEVYITAYIKGKLTFVGFNAEFLNINLGTRPLYKNENEE